MDEQQDDARIPPSKGFAKLDSGIVDSSLWMKDDDFLRVWIALLAKSDNLGFVRASESNFAHLCRITVERLREIIRAFEEPDEESRTPDNAGRRVKAMPGGWVILNYVLYRDMAQRKGESHAARQKRYRDRLKARNDVLEPGKRDGSVTRDVEAEAEAEAERVGSEGFKLEPLENKRLSSNAARSTRKKSLKAREKARLHTITREAIEAFNRLLGKPNGLLPSVSPKIGFENRVKQIKRVIETASEICVDYFDDGKITPEFWNIYFETVKADPFRSGRKKPSADHADWKPTFEYLTRPATMIDVYEKEKAKQ